MKTLYTAADIENLADSGQTTLLLTPSDILTPLARDRAREVGVDVRWEGAASPAAPSQPRISSRSPVAASGLAADALAAFVSLLQQTRTEIADVPHLAHCFDDLLRAVEQGDALHWPVASQRAGLSPDRQQVLGAQIEKMAALARYLFGPDSSHRRYDVLWALAAVQRLTTNN